ncbi:ribosome silencing factor [Caldisalinibacter kiritimatiensis]|uniref:Ribosomal silencing factor RsfS n=1 Tax=Caldisalinibacter kiritimatiensis TaxID=1304284 RepID=R1CM72_9FIRM|nr:ribosome silencing factor [Caldisalinibacter kiritimatiensis]EOC99805.1 Iojap protein [Caldisalinibacter kiritimatiensis]
MTEVEKRLSVILKAGDDKKAFDIKVLNISEITNIADYFIIFSGNSDRQVISIANAIEDQMKEAGYMVSNKEGNRTGRWVLLDYGDIVVHVFHKEEREFYNLERIWVDGKELDFEKFLTA